MWILRIRCVRIRLFVATVLLSTHETQVIDAFAFHGKVAQPCDPTGQSERCRWPTSFETSEATVTSQLVDDFDCELPEFSLASVGTEFQVNKICILIFGRCFCLSFGWTQIAKPYFICIKGGFTTSLVMPLSTTITGHHVSKNVWKATRAQKQYGKFASYSCMQMCDLHHVIQNGLLDFPAEFQIMMRNDRQMLGVCHSRFPHRPFRFLHWHRLEVGQIEVRVQVQRLPTILC